MIEPGSANFSELPHYDSPEAVVEDLKPDYPIYCVRPHAVRRAARVFSEHFPGDTLYAVKCNPMPHLLKELNGAGIHHFDTASLAEIALVSDSIPGATSYFMHPVKARSAIAEAHRRYGVRHFVVDHRSELQKIHEVIGADRESVIVVRLAVDHPSAVFDLSSKFGTSTDEAIKLLAEIEHLGFSAGLCFHVGSQCINTDDFRVGLNEINQVIKQTNVVLKCIDVGGGFPGRYLNFQAPEMRAYLDTIVDALADLKLPEDCQLLCEPGRGLSADSESLVVQIQLRKENLLFINDGIYGSMNEDKYGLQRLNRMIATREFSDKRMQFTLYGPTCDSLDVLSDPVELPDDVREGDWIEFGGIGAYGAACRTAFNGFYPNSFVVVGNEFVSDTSVAP